MSIAGFDPSLTNFGWVILDENKVGKESLLDSGTFRTSSKDGVMVQRIITQREKTQRLLEDWDIKFVSMEAPYFGDWSTEVLFALNQFIHEVFLNLGIFVLYIQPDSLRKISIPSMNPKDVTKHHMTHFAKSELRLHGKRFSEHQSDAYCAGRIGCKFYNWFILKKFPDSTLTDEERHLFCYKHTYVRGVKKGLTEYKGTIYRENDQFFDYSKRNKKTRDIEREVWSG